MSSEDRLWKRLADHLANVEGKLRMPRTDKRKNCRRFSAETALAKAAFEAATTSESRTLLKEGKAIVVVVAVPSRSWVSPISAYLGALLPSAKRISRDGTNRLKDLSVEGNEEVLAAIAESRSIIGISQAPASYLPSALTHAADLTIRIAQPDAAALLQAISYCLGGRVPKQAPAHLGAGLDFAELAAALRPGSTPAQAVQRLQSAAERHSGQGTSENALPTLQQATFYGDAREWGLSLAIDVAEARRTGDWTGVDRGACFFGIPGTGKTWLARMVAQACGLPIIESSVADLFGSSAGFLDSVVKAQRAVFAKAAALAPCILFWDEIEAMPGRATLSPRGRDFWLPVVDDFLLLVSSAPAGVIIIGATNHLELVDAALLRPGRLGRAIEIKPPSTAEDLAAVLRVHLRGALAPEDVLSLAHIGLGATVAQAMEWVRRAKRTARVAKRPLVVSDLEAVMAPADDRPPAMKRQTALHEAAHAVVTLALGAEELRSVTILPESGTTGGKMTVRVGKSLGMRDRAHFEDIVTGILAGRAAEVILCGRATAGAGGNPSSDLAIATRVVTAIHASLGLADTLVYRGDPASAALESALLYDQTLRKAVEADIQRLHKRAEALVLENRRAIEAVSDALLERRHLEADEVARIVASSKTRVASAGANRGSTASQSLQVDALPAQES